MDAKAAVDPGRKRRPRRTETSPRRQRISPAWQCTLHLMNTSSIRRLRIGVIGTGFGATVHVPALKASEDFEVVAVVSRRRENAERVAREAGIGWFSDDYRAMLSDVDLDAVSIATPGGLHHE